MQNENQSLPLRTFARISLEAIRENLLLLAGRLPAGEKLIAVIKANAYGHGAAEVGKALEPLPRLAGFAVAAPAEALELVRAGIRKPILLLGPAFAEDYPALIEKEIRLPVFREDMLAEIDRAAEQAGKKAYVHLALDTGMGRIGILPGEEGLFFVRRLLECKAVIPEGVFSHFARADEKDKQSAKEQLSRFIAFLDGVKERFDFAFPIRHIANSAAMMDFPEASFDLARAGIAMYGLYPSAEMKGLPGLTLIPALSWISHVSHLKLLPPGYAVSYGGTFVTKRETLVATIPVGYADGYPRSLSGKGEVLIRGKRARILGRVCMDQLMVDVTDIPGVSVRDQVTLIGRDGENEITVEELGKLSGRFNYELVCLIAPRVPRVYT